VQCLIKPPPQTLGSQTTAYDQRQQQVERQINVIIYQGREIAIPGVEASVAHSTGLLTTGLCN